MFTSGWSDLHKKLPTIITIILIITDVTRSHGSRGRLTKIFSYTNDPNVIIELFLMTVYQLQHHYLHFFHSCNSETK